MPTSVYASMEDFGKVVGVTRNAVAYAINKGKIKIKIIKGRKMIHIENGKKEWEANIDKTASIKGKQKGKKKSKKKVAKKTDKDFQPKTFEGLTISDAERQDKVYKARLSQLKYLELSGELVDASKVKKQAFEIARKLRDALMSIPTRMSHELAAETDPHKLEIILHKEIMDTLEKMIGGEK